MTRSCLANEAGNLGQDFTEGDHRKFNRNGDSFDKGETFSGIDYETGLAAVEALKKIFPGQTNLAPLALKWILQFDAVSCIIPGASNAGQVKSNINALNTPDFTTEQLQAVQQVYERYIKPSVHHLW